MLRKVLSALALAGLATTAHAQVAMTRSQLQADDNAYIKTNGIGAITGPILNLRLGNMNASMATLEDTTNPFANLASSSTQCIGASPSGSPILTGYPCGNSGSAINLANPPYNVTCTGADVSSAVITALAAANAAGIGDVYLPAGTCGIAQTVAIPSGVTLRGAGGALNWAAAGSTIPVAYPTRLVWTGAISGVMVSLGTPSSNTNRPGLAGVTIDGQVANGSLGTSGLVGLAVYSSIQAKVEHIGIQNVGVGYSCQPSYSLSTPNDLVLFGYYSDIRMLNVGSGRVLNPNYAGQTTGGCTNNQFFGIIVDGFVHYGDQYVGADDDNRTNGLYIVGGLSGSTLVAYNTYSPTQPAGVYANDIINGELECQNASPSTQNSLVVGATNLSFNTVFQGAIFGGCAAPSIGAGAKISIFDDVSAVQSQNYTADNAGSGESYITTSTGTAATAGINLGNSANVGMAQIQLNGAGNSSYGGVNSLNLIYNSAFAIYYGTTQVADFTGLTKAVLGGGITTGLYYEAINGGGSGTGGGSALQLLNNSASELCFGNTSACQGGAYSLTQQIYTYGNPLSIAAGGGLFITNVTTGTPTTYACFDSNNQLIKSAGAC